MCIDENPNTSTSRSVQLNVPAIPLRAASLFRCTTYRPAYSSDREPSPVPLSAQRRSAPPTDQQSIRNIVLSPRRHNSGFRGAYWTHNGFASNGRLVLHMQFTSTVMPKPPLIKHIFAPTSRICAVLPRTRRNKIRSAALRIRRQRRERIDADAPPPFTAACHSHDWESVFCAQ